MKAKLNGKEVDLSKAFPLTLGDWVALSEVGVLNDDGAFTATGPKMILDLLSHLAAKVNGEITREDVGTIPISELTKYSEWFQKESESKEPSPPLSG